jgi:hypothetical protein
MGKIGTKYALMGENPIVSAAFRFNNEVLTNQCLVCEMISIFTS